MGRKKRDPLNVVTLVAHGPDFLCVMAELRIGSDLSQEITKLGTAVQWNLVGVNDDAMSDVTKWKLGKKKSTLPYFLVKKAQSLAK